MAEGDEAGQRARGDDDVGQASAIASGGEQAGDPVEQIGRRDGEHGGGMDLVREHGHEPGAPQGQRIGRTEGAPAAA